MLRLRVTRKKWAQVLDAAPNPNLNPNPNPNPNSDPDPNPNKKQDPNPSLAVGCVAEPLQPAPVVAATRLIVDVREEVGRAVGQQQRALDVQPRAPEAAQRA